jgi:transcriptional regulator with XRE-family HTH domain
VSVADQFGANLRYCRRRAGLSQEETAVLASLHRTAVGQLERGERVARADTIAKLAGALNIDPGDLFDGIVWETGAVSVGRFELPEPRASLNL